MTQHASGTFQVKTIPQAPEENVGDPAIGRLAIEKIFEGDIQATSKGEMLGARSAVEGSAGYVALERVVGTLNGKRGSFVLQHSGTMDRSALQLTITIVPDSGTDELLGLAGTMSIVIDDTGHYYEMDYTLP